MELKGCSVDRIPEERKDKMLETLERMKDTRRRDDMYLRDEIKKKLDETVQEREEVKAAGTSIEEDYKLRLTEMENEFRNKMIKTNVKLMKIDGAIEILDYLSKKMD